MEKTVESEKQLILRIIKYVKAHHRVTLRQIIEALELDATDTNFLTATLARKNGEGENPNHIVAFVSRPKTNITAHQWDDEYQLLPTAIFSYIDYLEIVEARVQANDAKKLSLIAIQVAIWSLLLSTLVGLIGIIAQVLT